jgi:hypothetical protein
MTVKRSVGAGLRMMKNNIGAKNLAGWCAILYLHPLTKGKFFKREKGEGRERQRGDGRSGDK